MCVKNFNHFIVHLYSTRVDSCPQLLACFVMLLNQQGVVNSLILHCQFDYLVYLALFLTVMYTNQEIMLKLRTLSIKD